MTKTTKRKGFFKLFNVALATALVMTVFAAFAITACAEPESSHTHDFTYTASGDTITATCGNEGCDLPDSKVTLTIKAPRNLFYDDAEACHEATLENVSTFNAVTGKNFSQNDIVYFKGTVTNKDITKGTPKGATYTAKIAANPTKNVFGSNVVSVTFKFTSKPANAVYEQIGDFVGNEPDDVASAWKMTVTPIKTITSLGVKVNDTAAEEIIESPIITEGTVVVGIAVNISAKDVEYITAVVNDYDVDAENVD